MSQTVAVVVTLVVYQVVLLGVGYWARTRSVSVDGFLIGERNLGPWVAALSYAAGSSSAWSILGVSGIAFSQGLGSIWLIPGTITGHIVVWFWIAPRLQALSAEHRWVTLTDLLASGMGEIAGRQLSALAALVALFCFVFYVAAQFQGAANTFTSIFEFDFITALLIGVVVVVTYTYWGGFWAVSLTDALQAVLMLAASVVLPLTAYLAIGGLDGLADAYDPDASYWQLTSSHAGWYAVGFFIGMVSIGFGPLGQPHLLNRIMALRTKADVARARTVALVWFTLVLSGMYLLGVCAHIAFAENATESEQIFFVAAQTWLPAIFTGVLIAAVLSAIMSTADSQLLVAGAAIQHDLMRGPGEQHTGKNRFG